MPVYQTCFHATLRSYLDLFTHSLTAVSPRVNERWCDSEAEKLHWHIFCVRLDITGSSKGKMCQYSASISLPVSCSVWTRELYCMITTYYHSFLRGHLQLHCLVITFSVSLCCYIGIKLQRDVTYSILTGAGLQCCSYYNSCQWR